MIIDRQPHYKNFAYDTKERFCSYWHQIHEIFSLNPSICLEIGMGNGFVSNYLKNLGIRIHTMDILPALRPDVAGSVLHLPFADQSVDAVLCCQVLEHLPYADFPRALAEIRRVLKGHLVLSLPDVTTVYRIHLELPRLSKAIQMLIPHPFHRAPEHPEGGEHCWEIGKMGYPLQKIQTDIRQSGLKLIKTYRVTENYKHRFFLLKMI